MASWLLLITCFLAQIVGRVEVAEAMRCEIHLGDAHARLPTMHRALTTIERPHQQRQRKIAAIHGNQRLYAIGITGTRTAASLGAGQHTVYQVRGSMRRIDWYAQHP